MVGCSIPTKTETTPLEENMKHRRARAVEETEAPQEFMAHFGRSIKFDVSGLPIPQGSTRAFIVNKRPVITSTSKGLNQWRQLVSSEAQRRVDAPLEIPVAVTLHFRLPRPKSAPKKKRTYPDKRPDLDKLVRAVLDAITHVIISDDSQVVALTATKDYGPPGVRIEVDEIKI